MAGPQEPFPETNLLIGACGDGRVRLRPMTASAGSRVKQRTRAKNESSDKFCIVGSYARAGSRRRVIDDAAHSAVYSAPLSADDSSPAEETKAVANDAGKHQDGRSGDH